MNNKTAKQNSINRHLQSVQLPEGIIVAFNT